MQVVSLIVAIAKQKNDDAKKQLEIEDSGNKIAEYQGIIKGVKILLDQINEKINAYNALEFTLEGEYDVSKLSDRELILIKQDYIDSLGIWQSIEKELFEEMDRDKSFLYKDAKKERDLYVIHAKRRILEIPGMVIESIDFENKRRDKNEPLFRDFS